MPERGRNFPCHAQQFLRRGAGAQPLSFQQFHRLHGHGSHDEHRKDNGQAVHDHGGRHLLHAEGIAHQTGDHHDLHIGRDQHEQKGRQPQQRKPQNEIQRVDPGDAHRQFPSARLSGFADSSALPPAASAMPVICTPGMPPTSTRRPLAAIRPPIRRRTGTEDASPFRAKV